MIKALILGLPVVDSPTLLLFLTFRLFGGLGLGFRKQVRSPVISKVACLLSFLILQVSYHYLTTLHGPLMISKFDGF